MMVDAWNPRADEAARLAAQIEPLSRESAREMREVLRTIIARVEAGNTPVLASELRMLRRLVGMSTAPPRIGVARDSARRIKDAERLHRRMVEHGPMTTAQMVEWAGWTAPYANQIVVRLILEGRAERYPPIRPGRPIPGRPLFVYRAVPAR